MLVHLLILVLLQVLRQRNVIPHDYDLVPLFMLAYGCITSECTRLSSCVVLYKKINKHGEINFSLTVSGDSSWRGVVDVMRLKDNLTVRSHRNTITISQC